MNEDTYYSSVDIGTGKGGKEGKQEREKKTENKPKKYLIVFQQGVGQINLWYIHAMEYYKAIAICVRLTYPDLEHLP